MEGSVLESHIDYIAIQNKQIDLANKLIENANGDEEVIRIAKELIKSCEKCISIEKNMINPI